MTAVIIIINIIIMMMMMSTLAQGLGDQKSGCDVTMQ